MPSVCIRARIRSVVALVCAVLAVLAGCSRFSPASQKNHFFYGCAFETASEVDQMLKANPALIKARHSTGGTGLHDAVEQDNTGVVGLLLKRGIDVNTGDSTGMTPLHEAAMLGRTDIVRQLIAAGADVNTPDESKWSPLHMAVLHNHLDIVKLLVQAGASVNVPADDTGMMTPLFIAESQKHPEIAAYLRQHGAKNKKM